MKRILCWAMWIAAVIAPIPVAAQESVPEVEGPWPLKVLVFIASLPYTLYMVFVEGERLHLLPAPLVVIGLCLWSFREWRRQGYWTPRIVHVMAVLGLLTIIAINVDWVMAGGEMWLQRYVVIAVFGVFPYLAYLLFLGPKLIGRQRAVGAAGVDRPPPRGEPGPISTPRSISRSQMVVGGAAVFCVAIIGLMVAARASAPTSEPRPELDVLDDPGSIVPLARGVTTGNPDARITIMEFGDYQCPGCASFALRVKPRLDSSFVDTGRAKFVYFDLPLVSIHAHTFLASRAARCAEDQDGFWAYHDQLYTHQDEWEASTTPNGAFEGYASAAMLDPVAFRACLDSDRHVDLVEANRKLARSLGIRSTPTIIIRLEDGETREVLRRSFGAIAETIEEMTANGRGDEPSGGEPN